MNVEKNKVASLSAEIENDLLLELLGSELKRGNLKAERTWRSGIA